MGFLRLKTKQPPPKKKTLQLFTEKRILLCFENEWGHLFLELRILYLGKFLLASKPQKTDFNLSFFFFLIRRKKWYNQVVYWMFNASFKISAEESPVFFYCTYVLLIISCATFCMWLYFFSLVELGTENLTEIWVGVWGGKTEYLEIWNDTWSILSNRIIIIIIFV